MAGGRGFEPQFTSPEPVVLPLDDPPTEIEIQKKRNPTQVVRCKWQGVSTNRRSPGQPNNNISRPNYQWRETLGRGLLLITAKA